MPQGITVTNLENETVNISMANTSTAKADSSICPTPEIEAPKPLTLMSEQEMPKFEYSTQKLGQTS